MRKRNRLRDEQQMKIIIEDREYDCELVEGEEDYGSNYITVDIYNPPSFERVEDWEVEILTEEGEWVHGEIEDGELDGHMVVIRL